jgi:hypothetical protein
MDDYEIFKVNMLTAYRKRQQRAERIVQAYNEDHLPANSSLKSESVKHAVKQGQVARAKKRRASVVELVGGILGARAGIFGCSVCSAQTPLVRAPLYTLNWPLRLVDRKTPSPSPKNAALEDDGTSSQPSPHKPSGSGFHSEDIEAVLDKLAMMEKRQESVNADNKHQLLGVQAQYDSLGERLGTIERMLQSIVATADT